jgi:hypothetical protein
MGLWELGLHSIPPHVRPEFGKSRSQCFTLLHKQYDYDFYEKFNPMFVG